MDGSAETTNLLLTLLVVATFLTPLLLIFMGLGGYVAYRRLVERIQREVAPFQERAQAVLEDAEHLTHLVRRRMDQVDRTVDSLQHTGSRLSATMALRYATVLGTAARALATLLGARQSSRAPARAR